MSIQFKDHEHMIRWLVRCGYRQNDDTGEWYNGEHWAQIKRWKRHYTVYLRWRSKTK